MPAYNGNGVYVAIDGTDVSAYWTSYNLEPTSEAQDITRGSGVTGRQRAAGLLDYSFSLTLSYDATAVSTYIQRLKPGIHTVEIGPQGAVSGSPRHVQSFHFGSAPHEVTVEKAHVTFQVEGEAADVPTTDMYSGGVYA